jgi:adenylate cyclase
MIPLTTEELARQSGTTTDMVDRLAGLGLLEAPFSEDDIHRVRFAEALDAAGISLDDMARLVSAGEYSFKFIGAMFPGTGWPLTESTFAELAREYGLPWDAVRQMYTNWGLASPDPDQRAREDDLDALRERAEMRDVAGLDADGLIAATRFYGDPVRRLAAANVGFFREYVMEVMRARGVPRRELLEELGPITVRLRGYGARLRNWLYDRHLESMIFQGAIEEVEAALDDAGYQRKRSAKIPAIAFLDLGGFTRMTQDAGDDAAADLATRLVALVRRAASSYDGEVVKLLGDGVMFHFPHSDGAVACGLQLVDAAEGEGLPPARAGVHAGPVVFRDGDYFGRTVNLASRIVDYARPREVLVSEAVVGAAREGAELGFDPIGEITLRGLTNPVPLFRALNRDSSPGKGADTLSP